MSYNYKNQIFTLILTIAVIAGSTLTAGASSIAANFCDIENHWAKSYVEMVSKYNAVSGYPDGTFKPNDTIKRIEFIAIIVNSQGINLRSPLQGEYWGQPFIEAALEGGLILPNEYGNMDDATFNMNISREEMASIVVNAYINSGRLLDPIVLNAASSRLSDLGTVSPRYYENATASVALDFISGYPDGSFAPKQYASRAQAAVLSYKLLVKLGIITDDNLPLNIVLSKNKLIQGDVLKLSVYHADSPSELSLVQDLYSDFKWYHHDSVIQGVIPTNYSTAPGKHSLEFTHSETGVITTKTIEIVSRDFRVQKLTVDPSIESSTRNDEAYAEYSKYFNPSRESSSTTKYYSEPFVLPTIGRLSTEFGESRSVNGALTAYRHSGIDIAAPRGAEVLSTNRGRVTLAMPLILTGNTIVIDHGEGLFSVYFHLDKLNVAEGDIAERGQLIGTVGSTGFSTGPHLHFTMSYYQFNIEPGYVLYDRSITKDNYLGLMK
ncbi:peptidoglycan DD-metalloendopeptidase family protein [Acidaminobacter hydrogenoformans]|uniref:S-layer homology domain-containing protein n=1 Tax=Acidaminobacter hydrogenoformans DSM 2784 TaxID=1120920 RepID=A0A1G5S146_9FIRM|nr:peptidoglycan DD-metalloendopeptidase family protein [Acidaminobacter hydrogenoformans]SCZ79461.1 S-layer homology domain-containing protein [Acidaminobacter hydrogenoformans DSM 2784]